MKKIIITALIACMTIGCISCGKSAGETAATGDVSGEASSDTATESGQSAHEWTKEGTYKDENDNYLILYYTSKADGYTNDCWTVTAAFGDKFYGGEMEESDGCLSGTITYYDEDGEPLDDLKISLREDGDNIVLVNEDGSESVYTLDETDYSAVNEDMLPVFNYNDLYSYEGYDSRDAAAYDYLSHNYIQPQGSSNTVIPYVDIIGEDYSDPNDVLVYGSYYLFEFEKDGDTIVAVSGGHYPGIIHMEMTGDHDNALYYANSFDTCLSESEIEPMFGDYYDDYVKASNDTDKSDAGLAQVIADYVHANGLSITKYRISEGETKELPSSTAGDMPPDINYGSSEIYSIEDMDAAIALIRKEFNSWEGCELHTIEYVGDECNSDENIDWMNTLEEGQSFTQCIEFTSSFHSPVEGGGAWEADEEYENWGWYLARSDGGDWHLLTWGY